MEYNEETLRNYIRKCFEDAFKAENRSYDEKVWSFEWVLIKNDKNIYQLYPIAQCKYQRVLRRVDCKGIYIKISECTMRIQII